MLALTSTENMPAAWPPDTFLVESSQNTVVTASAPAAFSASSMACDDKYKTPTSSFNHMTSSLTHRHEHKTMNITRPSLI